MLRTLQNERWERRGDHGSTELEWWLCNNGNVGLLVPGPETAQLMASSMRAGIESALGTTPSAVPGV